MTTDNPPPRHTWGLFLFEMEGESAAEGGLPLSACPYAPDLPAHAVWLEGWHRAFKGLRPGGPGNGTRSGS